MITISKCMSFTALNTGGTYQHKLSVNEMPSHKHILLDQITDSSSGISGQVEGENSYLSRVTERADPKLRYWWSTTCSTGGGSPYSIMQPWISVYFWKRVK